MYNVHYFATHVILALTSLNVQIVIIEMSSLIHVIQDPVLYVMLNLPNSLQPRLLLFFLTALIDTLSLPLLSREKTYIIAGMNLAMLLQIGTYPKEEPLSDEICRSFMEQGKEAVVYVNDAMNSEVEEFDE
jgi:hypothetical protein